MRWQYARRGQSLVEFALALPVLLLVVAVFVGLLLVFKAQGTLTSVAGTAVNDAALAGGETPQVDADIVDLARQNGLAPALLRVRIDTDGGIGSWHWADWHDGPAGTDRSAWYPPHASYNRDVTVHLTYVYPLALPFVGSQTWTLSADASEASQVEVGVLPQ